MRGQRALAGGQRHAPARPVLCRRIPDRPSARAAATCVRRHSSAQTASMGRIRPIFPLAAPRGRESRRRPRPTTRALVGKLLRHHFVDDVAGHLECVEGGRHRNCPRGGAHAGLAVEVVRDAPAGFVTREQNRSSDFSAKSRSPSSSKSARPAGPPRPWRRSSRKTRVHRGRPRGATRVGGGVVPLSAPCEPHHAPSGSASQFWRSESAAAPAR